MSLRTLARTGIASIALSAAVLLAVPAGAAQLVPSIPIPPPLNLQIAPKLLVPTFKPLGPCTACSPTLPLPPPRAGMTFSR